MEKMRMTKTLADNLMDNLACLWISANDALIKDRNGEPTMTISDAEEMDLWVRNTFIALTEYWEEKYCKEWIIIDK